MPVTYHSLAGAFKGVEELAGMRTWVHMRRTVSWEIIW